MTELPIYSDFGGDYIKLGGESYYLSDDKLINLFKDLERFKWIVTHSAKVCHSTDGELCWVIWVYDNEEYQTKPHYEVSEAIDQAIRINLEIQRS